MSQAKDNLMAAINEACLSVRAKFVPFSQSRNAKEKHPSLNWKVTLLQGTREVVTTDYMAGDAHCPAYKKPIRYSSGAIDQYTTNRIIAEECETGRQCDRFGPTERGQILPDRCDVVHALIMDSEVLDYSGFDDWASSTGYDTDSREAERTYRACLEIALKIRASLGDTLLQALREAGENY